MTAAVRSRFAGIGRGAARLILLLAAVLLVAAALVPIERGDGRGSPRPALSGNAPLAAKVQDDDLAVYDAVIVRLRRGEGYYPAAAAEHRRIGFPLKPGLAVRMPTLARIEAVLGDSGTQLAAIALLIAVLAAWWRRLGEDAPDQRLLAMGLLAVNAALGLNAYFFALHELWAGMLLALSLALHRRGKWAGALAAAALALAIRELALPFAALMAALALFRREWREGAAWSALIALFAVGLAWHLALVAAQTLPGDAHSASWLALRGLSGWLSDFTLSSNLRYLPHWLAGPAIIAALVGWAGWNTRAGAEGFLLYVGYGLAFMIAGRNENYYWGAVVIPAFLIGLAFVPGAVRDLVGAARGGPDSSGPDSCPSP